MSKILKCLRPCCPNSTRVTNCFYVRGVHISLVLRTRFTSIFHLYLVSQQQRHCYEPWHFQRSTTFMRRMGFINILWHGWWRWWLAWMKTSKSSLQSDGSGHKTSILVQCGYFYNRFIYYDTKYDIEVAALAEPYLPIELVSGDRRRSQDKITSGNVWQDIKKHWMTFY